MPDFLLRGSPGRPSRAPRRSSAAALRGARLVAVAVAVFAGGGCRHRQDPGAPTGDLAAAAAATTSRPDPPGAAEDRLRVVVERLRADFRGRAGIYIRRLPAGPEIALDADETFPTASLIKLPLATALFDRVERGELSWSEPVALEKSRIYSQDDPLARFADGARLTPPELVNLMLAHSDNSASLWCQELAGGGVAVNAWLAARGYRRTRVNSRTPGREGEKSRYGWGQTTPREMAALLVAVRERRAVSPAADETLDRYLGRSVWSDEALSAVPPEAHVVSKQGAVNASRSEVLIVTAPTCQYVLCVITADQVDQSWTPDNEGFRLLRAVSAAAWAAFAPERPYAGAPAWPPRRNG